MWSLEAVMNCLDHFPDIWLYKPPVMSLVMIGSQFQSILKPHTREFMSSAQIMLWNL